MPSPRDTTRYNYKVGSRISHTGITNDPDRREAEHQREKPGGHLVPQGPKVTQKGAEKWERKQGKEGKPTTGYR